MTTIGWTVAGSFALLALAMLVLARISTAHTDAYARRIETVLQQEKAEALAQIEELAAALSAVDNASQAKLLRTEHAYSTQLKERDEEIARLKQQLADVVYEVKTPRPRKKHVGAE